MSVSATAEPRVARSRIRPVPRVDIRTHAPSASRSGWPVVLVIAAETSHRQDLVTHLSGEGFQVETATNAHEGFQSSSVRMRPDLVLIDAATSDQSGIELCEVLQSLASAPVIIVSTSNSEVDVVSCLEVGAADYVYKPFRRRELVARMRAVLRRATSGPPGEVLKEGPVTLDLRSHEVYVNGCAIDLALKEFELLHFFMTHVGQVVARESCIDRIWRGKELMDTRTLDTHVKRIRDKIEPDPSNPRHLVTFRGVGYRFQP